MRSMSLGELAGEATSADPERARAARAEISLRARENRKRG